MSTSASTSASTNTSTSTSTGTSTSTSTSIFTPSTSNAQYYSNNNNNSSKKGMTIRSRPRPRPRQLLDLPDEILCLILTYCSQDLDFLLWSCPLITADDQFCHDCYHCSLCHGPLHPSKQSTTSASLKTRLSRVRGAMSSSNNCSLSDHSIRNGRKKSTTGGGNSTIGTGNNRLVVTDKGNSSTSDSIVRKRRRRLAALDEDKEEDQRIIAQETPFNFFGLSLGRKGSQRCPYNGQRQWGDHPGPHQRHLPHHHHHQQHSSSFWSRHLPRRTTSPLHTTPLPPIQLVLPTTPSAFASTAISFISRRAQHQAPRLIEGSIESKATVIPGGSTVNAEDNPLPHLKPLSRTSLHHAFIRAQSWDQGTGHFESLVQEEQSMHTIVSHASRRRARSMTLTSSTLGGAFFPSERYIGRTFPSAPPQLVSPSAIVGNSSTTIESGTGSNSSDEQVDEEFTDAIELSAPFQLLLVNRRLADIVVRSLWKGIVFHGHDAYQVQALLSTLCNNDDASSSGESAAFQKDAPGLDLVKDNIPPTPTPTLLSVLDENESTPPQSSLKDSVKKSLKRFEGTRHQAQTLTALSSDLHQANQDRPGPHRRHSTTCVESAPSDFDSMLPTSPLQPQLPSTATMSRWSYRQMPRNIVLNFAHPQASPQLLVNVLECIGSYCHDQARALDFCANEKMQAAGLETPSELERLLGSGFSNLRYLRLQGGFVDNQLLGALTKGIISSTSSSSLTEATSQERHRQQSGPSALFPVNPPCRLSQVFLGPGSVTDSAIAKLILAASHCLEVFTVTSCVDVGGGALASLLTECPRLRVLAVHKSLARDMELLQGLGFDSDSLPGPSSLLGAILPILTIPSRKRIVAPLERLELGSVQLTTTGIAEIIRGVGQTLRFLVLEPRHFKESLLRDVIVPDCKKLEGLHFDDPDHYYRQQLQQLRIKHQQHRQHQQQRQHDESQRPRQQQSSLRVDSPSVSETERRPKRRLFKLKGSRRSVVPEPQRQDSTSTRVSHASPTQDEKYYSYPGPSPWLGETSTAEWAEFGNCALWAASAFESATGFEAANGGSMTNGNGRAAVAGHYHSQSMMSGSRGRRRGVSSFFRGISTRLVSILSPRSSNDNTSNQQDINTLVDTAAAVSADTESILARCGVGAEVVDMLRQVLMSTLKSFVVMQSDFLSVDNKSLSEEEVVGAAAAGDGDAELEILDEDEAYIRLAVVLVVMAMYESLVTLAITAKSANAANTNVTGALTVLPAEAEA